MSSNLKVNTILPSTGANVAIGTAGGTVTIVGNVDIDINSGISTFNDIHISDKIVHDGDTNTSLRFPAVDTFTVETAGIERLRIGSDGTLSKYYNSSTVQAAFGGTGQVNGITALPSMAGNPFVVGRDTGTLRSATFGGHLNFTSGYGIQGTEFSVYGNTSGLYLNSNVSGDNIIFQTHNGSSVGERVRITSTGKVNIGDTQMSQNIFNIEDGTAAALDIASHGSGGDTAYIGVKKSDGGGLTIGISNRDIIFKTGATYSSGTVFDSGNEKVRITSAGSMGVGTNTPDRKLDVSGTGNVYGKFQSTNTTGAGIEVKDISEDWLIQADGGSLDGLAFYDLGRTSYRFIMGNAGQFGVGSGSGRYGSVRQALVSGGGAAAPSWSSNPFLLDMDSLGDIDYDGVFLRYREVNVSGNGLVYLGLCKSTTNCPAGRIGVPVGYIPGAAYNSHFRVDKVGITPWPDGSGHRYEFYAIISDYASAGKLGIFYLTNSTN